MMGSEESKCSGKILLKVGYNDVNFNSFYTRNENEVNGPNIHRSVHGETYCVDNLGECSASVPILRYQYNGNEKSHDDLYIVGSQRNIPSYKFKETLCYAWPPVCEVNQLRSIEYGKILPIYEQLKSVKVYEIAEISCIGKRYPNVATEWWKSRKTIMCIVTDLNSIGWDPTPSQLQCSAACDEPTIESGQINGYTANAIGKVNAGTTVTVNCDKGFKLNPSSVSNILICRETDSQWYPDVTCETIPTCDKPVLDNGFLSEVELINLGKVEVGKTVISECNPGFKLSTGGHSEVLTCQEIDRKWHPSVECLVIPTCDKPVLPNGQLGQIKFNDVGRVEVGESVTVDCSHGYKLSNSQQTTLLTCHADGHWDPSVECLVIPTCDKPVLPNGQLGHIKFNDVGRVEVGESVTVDCSHGYKLSNSQQTTLLTCHADGHWYPSVTCQIVCYLKDLIAVPHSKISGFAVGDTVLYGQTVNFKCDGSRYPNDGSIWYSDSKSVKCNGPALWENITCTAACDLPKLNNGNLTGYKPNNINKVKSGATATSTCNHGYKLSNDLDSVTMTCNETDSQWHPSVTCKPICYAKDLESITYSKTNAGGQPTVNVGKDVRFECTEPRYPNVGDLWWLTKKIKCLESDKWQYKVKCSAACDKPILKHGQLDKYPKNTIGKAIAGTNVKVHCDYTFELSNGVDTETLTCQENDGKWAPNVTCEPRCKLQCINGGTCLENPMNGANKCACPIGFTGKLCEIEITGGTHTKELLEIRDQTAVITTVVDMEPYVIGQMTHEERYIIRVPHEEFISDCSFAGQSCPPIQHNNFTQTGSCYTINYDPNNVTVVNKAGRQQGVRLILFNNETEFVGHAIQSGMKLIIHKQGEIVFPENQGRFLSPGFHILIAMKYSETKRDKRKCASEEFLKTIDYFYDGDYTIEGCLKSCYQKKVIIACGCGDPRAALDPKNKQLAYCSVKEKDCVNNVGDITSADKCTCPEPCSTSLYELTYSSGKWPAKNYLVPFCEKIVRKSIWREEDIKKCNEAYRFFANDVNPAEQ